MTQRQFASINPTANDVGRFNYMVFAGADCWNG
jgi:hypothetical protein